MKKSSFLACIADIYEKTANTVNLIFTLMILCSIGAQVIMRTFFNMPLKFPEEVSVFALIALIYSGVGIVERHEEYLRVEVFQNMMPRKLQNFFQLIGKAALLVLIFGILQGEIAIFPSIVMLKSKAAKIPYSWLHGWIIICSVIWGFWVLVDACLMIRNIKETGWTTLTDEEVD